MFFISVKHRARELALTTFNNSDVHGYANGIRISWGKVCRRRASRGFVSKHWATDAGAVIQYTIRGRQEALYSQTGAVSVFAASLIDTGVSYEVDNDTGAIGSVLPCAL